MSVFADMTDRQRPSVSSVSDIHARLVATLAITDDMSLLEMSRHLRDMGEHLKRDIEQKPPCRYCDAGIFCWWHATHEQRMQHRKPDYP